MPILTEPSASERKDLARKVYLYQSDKSPAIQYPNADEVVFKENGSVLEIVQCMDIENSNRKRYTYWNRERYESFTIEWQNRTAQPECHVGNCAC